MRGTHAKQATMLTLMSPEKRVPQRHPLRAIKPFVEVVLKEMSPTFDRMYSVIGRSSLPPERLLKATLLMAFYTVRSERLFCEELDYNLLFRWFLDMDTVEPSFDHSTFSQNRDPGSPLGQEGQGQGVEAVVLSARADRKPERPSGRPPDR